MAAGSSGVSSTTSDRWWWRLTTADARADQSASTMAGSMGASAETTSAGIGPVGRPDDAGADPLVTGDDVDPVVGVTARAVQEQGRVHRGVEPGHVADPTGARARGVDDDDDASMLLRLPGPHTTTDPRRAVARQSIDLTSSPST